MSIKNLKQYEASVVTKSLKGLVLKEGEKTKLYDICIKYNVPITYPSLFEDDVHHSLWGISEKGIGLIGTIIMNYLSENDGTIFQSLDELEDYIKGE